MVGRLAAARRRPRRSKATTRVVCVPMSTPRRTGGSTGVVWLTSRSPFAAASRVSLKLLEIRIATASTIRARLRALLRRRLLLLLLLELLLLHFVSVVAGSAAGDGAEHGVVTRIVAGDRARGRASEAANRLGAAGGRDETSGEKRGDRMTHGSVPLYEAARRIARRRRARGSPMAAPAVAVEGSPAPRRD